MTDDRPPAVRGAVPWVVLSAVVVAVTVGFAQGVWLSNLHNGLFALAFTGVGTYVLVQRPGSREGALFVATGLVEAVLFLGRQLAHSPDGGGRWWPWLGVWPVVVGLALTTLSVIGFPDGRLPSARWRSVVAVVAVVTVVCAVLSALWPVEYVSAGVTAVHPVHAVAPDGVQTLWSALAHPAYVAFQVLWVVAVVQRWRTSSGTVRSQLAWVLMAAGVSVVALVVGLVGWRSPRAGLLTATVLPLAAGWAVVHGQRLAAYRALTWLSRSSPDAIDLPEQFTAAVAQALGARSATLVIGADDAARALGARAADRAVRPVVRGGSPVGALVVEGLPHGGSLSMAEQRLLDDLAAQAALVVEHQSLSAAIARQRRAGRLDRLTPREQEVLELVAGGLSNAAIGQRLHLSIKTVEPVVSTIFSKLDLHPDVDHNRRVLAVLAYLRS
ncbi:hypothetical protein GCM10027446_08570 [Angustibacter peucedani]